MFFVLNTGRAGSRTVAKTLSQSPNCLCAHEPHPQLVEECARYRYGELEESTLVEALRESRHPLVDGKIYGETNNRLALAVPALHAAFPDARFIHLVRDGRAFVSSGLQRGWYLEPQGGHPETIWERWRLQGDRVGTFDPHRWRSASPFERICWLWTYTNQLIADDLRNLVGDEHLLVSIESFPRLVDDVAAYIGVDPVPWAVGRANARQLEGVTDSTAENDINRVPEVLTWKSWSDEQRKIFGERCGALMDELYPAWRSDEGVWQSIEEQTPRDYGETADGTIEGSAPATSALDGLRTDVAELKMLREDLRSLVTHSRRVTDGLQLQLRQSNQQVDRLTEKTEQQRDAIERERDNARRLAEQVSELERAVVTALSHLQRTRRDAAALEGKASRSEEALQEATALLMKHRDELAAAKQRLTIARKHAKKATQERDRLLASSSYRVGHQLVRLARAFVPRRAATHSSEPREAAIEDAAATAITTARQAAEQSLSSGGLLVSTLVVAIGSSPQAHAGVASVLEGAAPNPEDGGPCPLIVTDSHDFVALRVAGVPFEYLVAQEDWAADHGGSSWTDYAKDRLEQIISFYEPERVVVVTEPPFRDEVLKLLPSDRLPDVE